MDNPALPGGSLKSKPTWVNFAKGSPRSAFSLTFGNAAGVLAAQITEDYGALPLTRVR